MGANMSTDDDFTDDVDCTACIVIFDAFVSRRQAASRRQANSDRVSSISRPSVSIPPTPQKPSPST